MNIERKETPNVILSIQERDIKIIIFISLIFREKNNNIRENMKSINNRDFIKIPRIISLG